MVLRDRLEGASKPDAEARDFTAATVAQTSMAQRRAARFGLYAVAVALFALHVTTSFPALRPTLRDIGDWDESWYIFWGYRLHQLHHPGLSANPIVGGVYAVVYPLAKTAEIWLVEACRLGRVIFCVATWLVLYAIVRESASKAERSRAPDAGAQAWVWITPLLLFTASAVPFHLLATPNYQWGNPSDATFAIVSGLAFWQVLRFHNRGSPSALALASAFLGLSVLARVDGLILSAVALGGVLALRSSRGKLRTLALPALLPFAAVIGTFLALYALAAGTLEQGISSRSYQAFEEGQAALRMSIADWQDYQLHSRPLAFDGDLSEVRALFGTSEENSGSVVRALINHPSAAIDRLARTLSTIPGQLVSAYGEIVVIPLLAFGLRGVRALIENRRFGVLTACLCWVLPLGSYLLFFYRPGYFLLPFFVPFALATVGLAALASGSLSARDRYWELGLVALGVASVLLGRPWLAVGAALALAIFVTARLGGRALGRAAIAGAAIAALLTFATRRAASRPAGNGAEERAVRTMRAHLPARSMVGAFGPGPVWAADPTFQLVSLETRDGARVATREMLERWVAENRVSAVYVNRALEFGFPESSKALSAAVGVLFDVGYQDAESGVRVLVTRPAFIANDSAR